MQGSTGARIAPLPHMMSSACIVMKRTPGRGGEERNWDEEMCRVTGTNREVERRVDENPCCHWEKLSGLNSDFAVQSRSRMERQMVIRAYRC